VTLNLFPFILLPLAASALCPFVGKLGHKYAERLSLFVLLFGLVLAVLNVPICAEYQTRISGSLGAAFISGDVFSLFSIALIYLASLAVAVFSAFYKREDDRTALYYALLMAATAAMSGVVLANDFFTLYVFVEVLAVCSFSLIAFQLKAEPLEGAIKYLVISAPASLFLIAGVSLLMLFAGSTSFAAILGAAGGRDNPAVLIIMGVMLCGFLLKSGLVPFHTWTPDAYQSAPTPVSALLSGIITKIAGVYAIIRIMLLLRVSHPQTAAALGTALMLFGAASIVVGALAAMHQKDFKRMLAYSSISQVGYIVLAAGAGTPLAIAGAIFHFFNHATFKLTLFFNGGALEKSAGTTDIGKLGGLENKMPWTSWTSVIAMLSTAGIPPLSGFWSKLIIIVALWQAGFHGYAGLALLASVLTLGYFLILQGRVFFGNLPDHLAEVKEARAGLLAPAVFFAALMVVVGLYFPFIFSNFVEPSVALFL